MYVDVDVYVCLFECVCVVFACVWGWFLLFQWMCVSVCVCVLCQLILTWFTDWSLLLACLLFAVDVVVVGWQLIFHFHKFFFSFSFFFFIWQNIFVDFSESCCCCSYSSLRCSALLFSSSSSVHLSHRTRVSDVRSCHSHSKSLTSPGSSWRCVRCGCTYSMRRLRVHRRRRHRPSRAR